MSGKEYVMIRTIPVWDASCESFVAQVLALAWSFASLHLNAIPPLSVLKDIERFSGGCDPIATMAKPTKNIVQGDRCEGFSQRIE